MKESQFLGTLLPSHPDFLPIEQSIREKYNLPEISPGDEEIGEIFLGEEPISLEEFRKDIEKHIRENLSFLPPELLKIYQLTKSLSVEQINAQHEEELENLPPDIKVAMEASFKFTQTIANSIIQLIDPMISAISDALYLHLLTGRSQETPDKWIGTVTTVTSMGEPMVIAMAGQMANPETIMKLFREECKKTFGSYHPRVSDKAINAAYYLQLQKSGKPWGFIVEQYMSLNHVHLPQNRTSKRYITIYHREEQKLRKRMQRMEKILDALVEDKK